jgi:hypothetical protein
MAFQILIIASSRRQTDAGLTCSAVLNEQGKATGWLDALLLS